LGTSPRSDDLQDVQRWLRQIDVRRLVRSLCVSQAGLETMSAESYHHANGFEKLTLPPFRTSPSRLRIHVWHPDSAGAPSGDAHNHRWILISRVLRGTLAQEIYRVGESPGHHILDHYRHEALGGTHQFEQVGTGSLVWLGTSAFAVDSVYSLAPEVIHRVHPGGYTATLMLELPPARTTTDVYSRSAKPVDHPVAPVLFTADQVREKLLALESLVAG
jgi:hypothetical protein